MFIGPLNTQAMSAPLKHLFIIQKIKIFETDSFYVALFGEPAQAPDGWIINILASQFFTESRISTPPDVMLDAEWVKNNCAIRPVFHEFIHLSSPECLWRDGQANPEKTTIYKHADMFRDISLILENHNLEQAALSFITKAYELRPDGPAINRRLNRLKAKVNYPSR